MRTHRSCTGTCRKDDEDSFEQEAEDEEVAAMRVVRSELKEEIVDAVTETAIWMLRSQRFYPTNFLSLAAVWILGKDNERKYFQRRTLALPARQEE